MEKGIDLFLALDAIDLGLTGQFDVAIVVSLDKDLAELPPMLRRFIKYLGLPMVRVEAAVVAETIGRPRRGPRILPGFDYTHQVTYEMFQRAVDRTDYTREA